MKEQRPAQHNGFSVASLIFGLLALLTGPAVIFIPFNSGLALTFAFLSRGDQRMSAEAKLGVLFSVLGIIIAVIVTAAAVSFISGSGLLRPSFPVYYDRFRGILGTVGRAL